MNVGLVFFAYGGDAQLLRLALQAVPLLRKQGHEVTAYVLEDAAAPLGELGMPSGCCRRWQTSWARCGNLNGLECIVGMVDEYNSIFEQHAHEWLLKVDCDTFVNSLDWLEGLSSKEVAFAGTVHVRDYCSGACYAVSREGAEWLQARLLERSWRDKAERGYCEDRVLCSMCRLSGMKVHALDGRSGSIEGKLCHAWQGEQRSFAELRTAYAVDFKACRWNSAPHRWELDHAEAVERMRNYVKEVTNG